MKDFLQKVFGFEALSTQQDWIFNWKHLIIAFCVMAFVIFFSMYYYRKSKTHQKVFLILSGVFLLLLEIGRIVWNALYLKSISTKLTFWNVTDLNLFNLSVWFSIIILFLVCAIGYKRRFSQLMLNYIFTITAVVAIIDIIYPIGLNERLNIYHFYNLQFLISRAIIVLVALFIGSSDWLDNSLDDVWMAILSLVFMIGIGVGIYYLSGKIVDVIYIRECPWLTMSGINVKPPYHMFIVALFFFGMQVLMYLPFDIYRKIRYKNWKPNKF